MTLRKYVRRPDRPVAAVRMSLDTDGLVYRKWGGEQRAKPGDWIVDNNGDVYTVDAAVFAATYRAVDARTSPGSYVKTTPVWAARADKAGAISTKEGATHYDAGDFIVSNKPDGSDSYAITAARFNDLYIAAPDA